MRTAIRISMVAAGASLVLAGAGPVPARASACSVPLFAWRSGTVVLNEGGRVTRVRVEIADTPERQQAGLMCRNTLDPDGGMLFMFPASTRTSFWMKNTLIPLAIAFIDTNWHIIQIMEMPVAPDPTADDQSKFPLYDPHRPFRYALEVNAGFFAKHQISDHAELRFIPPEGGAIPSRLTITALP
jgi:uncharacterized protein